MGARKSLKMKTISQFLDEKSNDYSAIERKYYNLTNASLCLNLNNPPPIIDHLKPLSATVVIPAWNASSTILSCLTAIEQSSFNIKHQDRLQVVIVDDGSTDKTWEIVKSTPLALNLTIVKQQNLGQAKALNTGISIAEGDIIISCDADMILNYYAIEHFVTRHQLLPNVLLVGFRTDTTKDDLRVDPSYIRKYGSHVDSYFIGDERIVFSTPGWPNNMSLASGHYKHLGNAKGLWMPGDDACVDPWRLSDLVFGALFSLSKDVYLRIGGYDERLHGWGCTDSLLAAKAISSNQYVIPIYSVSGLHISHPFRTKDKQLEYSENRKKFFEIIQSENIDGHPDWITHAKDRIIESFTQNPVSNSSNSVSPKEAPSTNQWDNLLAIGEYSEVCEFLTKIKSTDNNNDLDLKLGKALIGMNQYEQAVDILDKLPIPTIELVIAKAANGQFTQAHQSLVKFSQVHPEDPSLSYWYKQSIQKHLLQGSKYFDQGFTVIAKRCFEAALIADPNDKLALKYRNQCSESLLQ